MKLRILSDLHNEFRPFEIPEMKGEGDQVLILAGDIFTKYRMFTEGWIRPLTDRFKEVIFVPGNHDYWRSSLDLYPGAVKGKAVEFDNFHILEKEFIDIEGVRFLGATLWTDFHKNPLYLSCAPMIMNDYRKIRDEAYGRKLRPERILGQFQRSVRFLNESFSEDLPNVVITHHAPCELSVPPRYKGRADNCYYYSDLSELIYENSPSLWIHGHIHSRSDYQLYSTRVVCNPRGYFPDEIVEGFDPFLIVEV